MIIYLKCIKIQGKLRVRIINTGFYTSANCQFPRDLREEGQYYSVDESYVSLISTRGKHYYSVKNKKAIAFIGASEVPEFKPVVLKVYQDIEQEECLICYDAPKESVFSPCGHFYTCTSCGIKCKTCPICRQRVEICINKADMD